VGTVITGPLQVTKQFGFDDSYLADVTTEKVSR
jgi:hypothetical protein